MKVLISTLGKGNYKESVYVLPDNSEVKTKLLSYALREYLNPEEIYIIGTEESLWNLADELIGNYKRVIVPFGKRTEEFWGILREILKNVEVENREIYIDITHGFRTLPFFISTVINLFTKVKRANIIGVFYGIFEVKDEKGRVPVVDLMPIVKLNEWIEGFTLLNNYGDGNYISKLIDNFINDLSVEQRKSVSELKAVSSLLRKYSEAVGFNAIDYISKFANQVSSKLDEIDFSLQDLEALSLLKDYLKEVTMRLSEEEETLWKKQIRVTEWLFEKNRYAQAIISLEESIFTYIMEYLCLDPLNKKREKLGNIFCKDREKHEIFTKEMNILFSRVQNLRNKTSHAFMKSNTSEGDIKRSIDSLNEYIENAKNLILSNKVINNIELLKKEINLI